MSILRSIAIPLYHEHILKYYHQKTITYTNSYTLQANTVTQQSNHRKTNRLCNSLTLDKKENKTPNEYRQSLIKLTFKNEN